MGESESSRDKGNHSKEVPINLVPRLLPYSVSPLFGMGRSLGTGLIPILSHSEVEEQSHYAKHCKLENI